jgi:hypothetical protein
MTPSFPLSLGCDFRLHSLLGLGLMYTFRPLTTDLFDNLAALGRRPGNDQLHELTLSMHIFLQTTSPPAQPPRDFAPSDSLPPPVAEGNPEIPRPDWRRFLAYHDHYLARDGRQVEPLQFPASMPGSLADHAPLTPITLPRRMTQSQAAAYLALSPGQLLANNPVLPDTLATGTLLWLPLSE